ncbi:hypothetical protein FRX31_005695 [Thalictrum thalictroides]|uniref:Uncharacterized protein n=1 Tax=Thalictrum thalictroides TaxID=46969 RepID=A0A7J6X751_THATH|nr:hypothetical protein FRX31_005695 [Thalictrum thalictroides]
MERQRRYISSLITSSVPQCIPLGMEECQELAEKITDSLFMKIMLVEACLILKTAALSHGIAQPAWFCLAIYLHIVYRRLGAMSLENSPKFKLIFLNQKYSIVLLITV